MQASLSPIVQANEAALRAAKDGFEWNSPFEVAEKVREELEEILIELRKAPSPLRQLALQDELGDLFFVSIGLARHCGVDPETAVMTGLKKFQKQYARFEAHVKAEGLTVSQMSVPERVKTWRQLKEKTVFPFSAFPIETERLILRPLEEGDALPMTPLANDARVAQNLARLPHPYTLQDAQDCIERVQKELQEKSDATLAVIRKEDHAFMGVVSIEGETVGYWLGHPFWGQGYGTEAMTALVTFAMTVLQKQKIESSARVDNLASRRIFEKLGFVEVGTKDIPSLAYEGTKPAVFYQLLREDFVRGKAA